MHDYLPEEAQERILVNGDFFSSLLRDIQEAKKSIDLEIYMFNEDAIGKKIGEALIEASKRGVTVRILVDGAGSPMWGGPLTKQIEAAGIETHVYHPFPWNIWHWSRDSHQHSFFQKLLFLLSKVNSRNHRKVVIIDKHILYVGSANIAMCHLSKEESGDAWRDTSVRLTNVRLRDVQYAFDKAWGGISLRRRLRRVFRIIQKDPTIRLNDSLVQRNILYKQLISKIARAKTRIWITNAYFVPDNVLLKKLAAAAKKGIDVKLLLPHESDVPIVSLVSNTFYIFLLKSGVKIFEYLPSVLHAKLLIIDDWYLVGSSNLNYRSLRHDLEVDVSIQTSTAKAILERQFIEDLKESKEVFLVDLNSQPFYKKIIGRILLFVRYWI